MYKVISLLVENHIFLRSGVTKPRYIHHRYVDPWLIHSYKIYRLEQESLIPFKDSIYATRQQGQTAEINAETIAKDTNLQNEDTDKKRKVFTYALISYFAKIFIYLYEHFNFRQVL